jgi:hypothetical protein
MSSPFDRLSGHCSNNGEDLDRIAPDFIRQPMFASSMHIVGNVNQTRWAGRTLENE